MHIHTYLCIGRFSKAGLHKWMPFVIFRARSRERSWLSVPGWFFCRRWFTLCITIEVQPRIAKQYKCRHCCSCKNYRGKGMEGEKIKCLCVVFWLTRRSRVRGEKKAFWGIYSTSNKLLLVARHILTTGLQKYLKSWQCKIRKFTVTAFHCEESTHRK